MNRKAGKKCCAAVAALLAAVSFSATALADWETRDGKTYYTEENGNPAKGWKEIDGKTYYFTSDGEKVTSSRTIGGIRYRFDPDGVCKGKYTGWTKGKNGRRYYKNGVMAVNRWIRTKSGKKYYAGADGYMRTGWARIKGTGICFFDENGVWDEKRDSGGYQPRSMKTFLTDFDYSDDLKYESAIDYRKYRAFDGIVAVREILEAEGDAAFVYDRRTSDDETEINEEIYLGGKLIVIRCDPALTGKPEWVPHLVFSKDKKGNSYLYVPLYGFGGRLSDDGAYDKIAAFLPS